MKDRRVMYNLGGFKVFIGDIRVLIIFKDAAHTFRFYGRKCGENPYVNLFSTVGKDSLKYAHLLSQFK